jgi:methylenetetrahydrofolate reductase (NAD(P)H)
MKMTTVHPALSYELYPPRSHASCDSLLKTIAELEQTNPDYVSVTYSGDAQRRQKTLALLDHLVHETSLNPLAHLICVGHSVADLERSVRLILGLGVRGSWRCAAIFHPKTRARLSCLLPATWWS